jgi:iron complex transport system ATP-binding protein
MMAADFSKHTSSDEHSSIRVQGLGHAVGDTQILHPLNISLASGQVHAILGPNGAGKSTLLNLLSGQERCKQGKISINGKALPLYAAFELARFRAVMPQSHQVAFDFSVREIVDLGRYPHRLHPSQQEAGIADEAMRLADVLQLAHRQFNTLSGGEKARVQLARALAQLWQPLPDFGPRWLLLDEPTAALDLSHQYSVMRIVLKWAQEQGVGVVAVLHDLNLAMRFADNVVVLDRGHLKAAGSPSSVLQSSLFASVWQVNAQILQLSGGATIVINEPLSDTELPLQA